MLKVAQRVDNGDPRILGQLDHGVVRIDSGDNPIKVPAQNPCCILHRLSSAKLKLAGGKVDRVSTKSTGSNLKARPGSGRRLLEKQDRKSTRLNSSHLGISYAVFCLKKKKKNKKHQRETNNVKTNT